METVPGTATTKFPGPSTLGDPLAQSISVPPLRPLAASSSASAEGSGLRQPSGELRRTIKIAGSGGSATRRRFTWAAPPCPPVVHKHSPNRLILGVLLHPLPKAKQMGAARPHRPPPPGQHPTPHPVLGSRQPLGDVPLGSRVLRGHRHSRFEGVPRGTLRAGAHPVPMGAVGWDTTIPPEPSQRSQCPLGHLRVSVRAPVSVV